MIILVLPFLCVIHVMAVIVCAPIIVACSAIKESADFMKQLLDVRDTYRFVNRAASHAWKMMGKE